MIAVTVELWPAGNPALAEVIGRIAVANTTPASDPASYHAAILDGAGRVIDARRVAAHQRAEGIWTLLAAILTQPSSIELDEDITAALARRISPAAAPPDDTP